MQYKAIEYQVVRTANPTGWKWIVQLGATRTRIGASYSMKSAVLDAQRKIDKELKTDKKLMSVKAKQSPLFRPVSVTRTDALHGGLAMSRKSALSLRMDNRIRHAHHLPHLCRVRLAPTKCGCWGSSPRLRRAIYILSNVQDADGSRSVA